MKAYLNQIIKNILFLLFIKIAVIRLSIVKPYIGISSFIIAIAIQIVIKVIIHNELIKNDERIRIKEIKKNG